ncbi:MAG: T9SS type A sorting domain-containing protein [Ignavibacteriaceae bacterium]|nr:T9SS type A sorting domain-containing protein [Ignavibacteriaceae bacterium]
MNDELKYKIVSFTIFFYSFLIYCNYSFAQNTSIDEYQFVSPIPNSTLNQPGTTIILREGNLIDESTLDMLKFIVEGSKSGKHNGDIILAGDSKTLIFKPATPFELGEKVYVKLVSKVKIKEGRELPSIQFSFKISDRIIKEKYSHLKDRFEHGIKIINEINVKKDSDVLKKNQDLPQDFPEMIVTTLDNPSPGFIFMSPYSYPDASFSYLLIIDNRGVPVFYLRIPRLTADFKVQHNGSLTFYDYASYKFFELDSSYAVIDSFACGNGYPTDDHEFLLFPNGHSFLMAYDWQPVRMDTIVPGGDSTAIVIGLIIQELDADKNVIFQWRSWDHFQITDATADIDLTAHTIDYVHGNAIEITVDGNLLISSRHLDEITKINRQTGEIIWRLGGLNARNNDFQFINDPVTFSHQHDIRELSNGNLTLFDNGNLHNPQFSRSLEYQLDEINLSAELVWDYNYTPTLYSPAMGSSRKLDDNNTVIGWGLIEGKTLTEVKPDGSISLDISLADSFFTYRAFKFPWRTNLFVTNRDSVSFSPVSVGDSSSIFIDVISNSNAEITITGFYNTEDSYVINHPLPFTILPFGSEQLEIKFKPIEDGFFRDTLHIRSDTDTSRIAQILDVVGITDSIYLGIEVETPVENFILEQNYPNPFNPTTKITYSVPVDAFVNISVYNLLGEKVANLLGTSVKAGNYEIRFDATNLASGIYIYRMCAGGFVSVKKMMILK